MIFVSDSAKEKISEIRSQEKFGPDYFVRVSVTSGGCSGLTYMMDFDNESKPNDQVFEDNGVKVVTDLKSFLYLFNTTLEFSGGLNGKGFSFNNPNAARTCGCGESFAANVGGRMIGTSFAALATWLATVPKDQAAFAPTKMAYVAASIAFGVYLVSAIACFWLPEPKEGEFGDD